MSVGGQASERGVTACASAKDAFFVSDGGILIQWLLESVARRRNPIVWVRLFWIVDEHGFVFQLELEVLELRTGMVPELTCMPPVSALLFWHMINIGLELLPRCSALINFLATMLVGQGLT